MLFRGVGLVGGSLRVRAREGNRGRGIEGVREGRDDGCTQCAAVGVSKSSGMSLRARMHTHTDARHYPVQRRAPVLVFSVHLLRLRALGHARGRRQRAPRATRARARESPTSGSSCFNFSTSPSRAASICATCRSHSCADFARTGEKKEKMLRTFFFLCLWEFTRNLSAFVGCSQTGHTKGSWLGGAHNSRRRLHIARP